VVEAAGMSAHCDFQEQVQSGDAKPDMIVRLPGDRVIVVDAKVPELEFVGQMDEADPVKRSQMLANHASKLRLTIRDLASRDYPAQFPSALDFVVLFLPAESLFSAALEADQEMIVWAAERKILLATPASLIALLRSVSVSWKQHAQTENARAIAQAAEELYKRISVFVDHLDKIRAGLDTASNAYNKAVGSYERSIRPSGERILKLANHAEQEMKDLPPSTQVLRDAPKPNPEA
jgi:DNA recombination protein RmuC